MTSPDPLAERLGSASRLSTVVLALRARVQAPHLDSDLAAGIWPSASAAHLARADRITRPRARRRIRAALNRAIGDAFAPQRRLTSEAPLSRAAIRNCREELSRLAETVVATENPRVQGVAIAHQLAFDGRGALFFQRGDKRSVERLANTIRAAQSALRVSGDFDRRSGSRHESRA
jgi:hypothetical protein